jgi:dTMP kinase
VSGAFVAIEGIDGSGKGTQAGLLVQAAERRGLSTSLFSFPLYDDNPFSIAVGDYLNGVFGTVDEVHAELAGLLYACDRFHARPVLRKAIAENDLVVCDRYVASNLAHQGAKLGGKDRERLIRWLTAVEFGEFELPRPDLVVLLDLAPTAAQSLVSRKSARSYTAMAADIHEGAREHLASARDVYLDLAARDSDRWRVIPAGDELDRLRTPEEIAAEVWMAVQALVP